MDNEQKKQKTIDLTRDGNKTINSIRIHINNVSFEDLINHIRESFKVLPFHISNIDKYYEVVGLFLILYTNMKDNKTNIVFKFKFTPENKLNREYMAIPILLQILSHYEYELIDCAYYNDVKPTYIHYLFNTKLDHLRAFNYQ